MTGFRVPPGLALTCWRVARRQRAPAHMNDTPRVSNAQQGTHVTIYRGTDR